MNAKSKILPTKYSANSFGKKNLSTNDTIMQTIEENRFNNGKVRKENDHWEKAFRKLTTALNVQLLSMNEVEFRNFNNDIGKSTDRLAQDI